jgi:hypothetical protein
MRFCHLENPNRLERRRASSEGAPQVLRSDVPKPERISLSNSDGAKYVWGKGRGSGPRFRASPFGTEESCTFMLDQPDSVLRSTLNSLRDVRVAAITELAGLTCSAPWREEQAR